MKLKTKNIDEKKIFDYYFGKDYVFLEEIKEKCYVLTTHGKFFYNECFTETENEFFKKQRYDLVIPTYIVKFFHYYIMYSDREPNLWFRGVKNSNGNIEFDCCGDTVEEIVESL